MVAATEDLWCVVVTFIVPVMCAKAGMMVWLSSFIGRFYLVYDESAKR